MMRSDKGEMVSLSIGGVIRRKRRLLPKARLHQFHRPSDGTSGELGFIRPRSSFSFLLIYMNSYKMSMAICLIDSNKQYFVRCERSIHLCFVGMNGRPLGRASCQSPKPKGGAEGAEIDSERARQATIGSP
jgi:hypothetical protein